MSHALRSFTVAIVTMAVVGLLGCGRPAMDPATKQGKAAILDEVSLLLTNNECEKAIKIIDPVYNSSLSDNEVRLARASAYACAAGFNFFSFLATLQNNKELVASPVLWQILTREFPSTLTDPLDRRVEAAEGSIDALLASIREYGVIAPLYLFNTNTFNPQTQLWSDRTGDSNIYLTFLSMAAIGSYQHRYGSPNTTNYKKGANLPWTTANATDMDTIGCGYASALVNFADALGGFEEATSGEVAKTIGSVKTLFQQVIYGACEIGCMNSVGVDVDGSVIASWNLSGCTANVHCASCPYALRDRTSCTGTVSNVSSCAAAGLVNFMNTHTLGWQGP